MGRLLALLSHLSLRNKHGHTALYIAAVKGLRPSRVELLLPHMRREVLLVRHRNEGFGEDWVASEEKHGGGVSVLLAATHFPRQAWMGEASGVMVRSMELLMDAIGCDFDRREYGEILETLRKCVLLNLVETAWATWQSERPSADVSIE
ncbi:hypothetical protein ACKVWC_004955 [Pyricularia oryzae]